MKCNDKQGPSTQSGTLNPVVPISSFVPKVDEKNSISTISQYSASARKLNDSRSKPISTAYEKYSFIIGMIY